MYDLGTSCRWVVSDQSSSHGSSWISRRNLLTPSPWYNNKPRKHLEPNLLFPLGSLLTLIFHPEDGGNIFLRNFDEFLNFYRTNGIKSQKINLLLIAACIQFTLVSENQANDTTGDMWRHVIACWKLYSKGKRRSHFITRWLRLWHLIWDPIYVSETFGLQRWLVAFP
jgi:hypothetical protein